MSDIAWVDLSEPIDISDPYVQKILLPDGCGLVGNPDASIDDVLLSILETPAIAEMGPRPVPAAHPATEAVVARLCDDGSVFRPVEDVVGAVAGETGVWHVRLYVYPKPEPPKMISWKRGDAVRILGRT